jgi:hypothetical protein
MTYRRPAITVIQEFTGLVADITALALPGVSIGPAYQLVNSDLLGAYSGNSQNYPYATKLTSAIMDLSQTSPSELFPSTRKDVEVLMTDAVVRVKNNSTLGIGVSTAVSDATLNRFQSVVVGDYIEIVPSTNVQILAPVTDGSTASTSASIRKRLVGTVDQYVNVKIGDTVTTTGGTNTVIGSFIVVSKIGQNTLVLNAAINDNGGASTDVAYSISGSRGALNTGVYKIKLVTDVNNIVLESPLVENESFFTYFVKRKVASISLARGGVNGFTPTLTNIELPASLTYLTMPILEGTVKASYRALRTDLYANVKEFSSLNDIKAVFGVDQITPQNPLAYALFIMKQNTTTPVNGLGLDGNALSDETLAFSTALDVLGETEMYALAPLTQSPAIHQMFNTHISSMSSPDNAKERVAIVNRLIKTEAVLKEESTTSVLSSGSRIIVNTQVDGEVLLAAPTELLDQTPDAFLFVEKGDTLVVTGGVGAILGEYEVTDKTDNNNIVLSAAIVNANESELEYYIIRKDGIGSNGITFYDRSATFLTDNVAVGYKLRILTGTHAGDYVVNAINSEKSIDIAQVPGVTSLVDAVNYEIVRDLPRNEQAQFISTYSSAFGNRRMVNVWPDTVKSLVGSVVESLPGFYACSAVAAATTGLPSHQGFTGLELSGFLGFEHSTGYFKSDFLNTIADGGTFILEQAGEETPLFVRHQLTTDRSAIKYQEYSVTKNVDFISKTIRNQFKPFLDGYNIYEGLFEQLKTTAKSVIVFLKESTIAPKIGGAIRSGELTKIAEHETQIDTVVMRFKFAIPIPLNYLEITIEV